MKKTIVSILALAMCFCMLALGEADSLVGVWKIDKYTDDLKTLTGSGAFSGSDLFEFTPQGTILHHSSDNWRYDSTEDTILVSVTPYSPLDFLFKSDREPVRCDYMILEGRLIIKGYLAQNKWQLFDKTTETEGLVGIWRFAGIFGEEGLPVFLNAPGSYVSGQASFSGDVSYTLEFTARGKLIDTKTFELCKYKAVDGNRIILINNDEEPADLILDFRFEKETLVISLTDKVDGIEEFKTELFLKRVK